MGELKGAVGKEVKTLTQRKWFERREFPWKKTKRLSMNLVIYTAPPCRLQVFLFFVFFFLFLSLSRKHNFLNSR